jgi:hypothetical protein
MAPHEAHLRLVLRIEAAQPHASVSGRRESRPGQAARSLK